MKGEQFARRTLLAAGTLGVVLACNGSDVLRPSAVANGIRSASAPQASHGARAAQPVKCAPVRASVSSGVFGPGGGTLLFGDSRLVIPGGALTDTVTITATTLGDSSSTVYLEPSGLHFAKPAGLVLGGGACALPAEATPNIVSLDASGNILEVITASYDPHWKLVAAPIEHFSGYAIAF